MVKPPLIVAPPIIAHRGASALAPENTLSAFLKAQQLNIRWVEFDVMLAACGEVIVFHDETLERTTNKSGKVIDYPYTYLKTLDAGSWFDTRFAGEKIPTLNEVLNFLAQYHMFANIEIKALPGQEEQLVQRVLKIIADYQSTSFFISSFSLKVLELVRQYSSTLFLGVLMDEWHDQWQETANRLQADAMDVNHQLLDLQRAEEIKANNRLLLAYTVNDPRRAVELLALGVDAVFSDCSEYFLSTFKETG